MSTASLNNNLINVLELRRLFQEQEAQRASLGPDDTRALDALGQVLETIDGIIRLGYSLDVAKPVESIYYRNVPIAETFVESEFERHFGGPVATSPMIAGILEQVRVVAEEHTVKFNERYTTPETCSAIWQGREGRRYDPDSRWFQVVEQLNIQTEGTIPEVPEGEQHFVLLGFACDQGVINNHGNPGANEGPDYLRRSLAGSKVLLGDAEKTKLFDAGNVTCDDGDLHSAQDAYAEAVRRLVLKGYTVIAMGGGHEIAYPNQQGILKALQQKALKAGDDVSKVGVNSINLIDAHSDVRHPNVKGADFQRSSGTPFRDIWIRALGAGREFLYYVFGLTEAGNDNSLFETLKAMRAKWIMQPDYGSHNDSSAVLTKEFIEKSSAIHASVCLDGIEGVLGVSARPAPGKGVPSRDVYPVVERLARSGKVHSLGIAELNKTRDLDGRTGPLAADIINHYIAHATNYSWHESSPPG